VNNQVDVLMDGGIRRGGDIVKALCLGAKAVLIGRAYAYGLGAAGQAVWLGHWKFCGPMWNALSDFSAVLRSAR